MWARPVSGMMRWALPVAVMTALLLSPMIAGPAVAADVNVTLIAFNIDWHVASQTAPTKPTITVNPADVLRLRIENHDAMDHTFTFPHFAVDRPLVQGATIFVNITTSTADNGKWQFYCNIPGHSTGPNESRTGMVGWVQVGATTPPPTPGFEVVLVIAALGIVAAAVRLRPRKGN